MWTWRCDSVAHRTLPPPCHHFWTPSSSVLRTGLGWSLDRYLPSSLTLCAKDSRGTCAGASALRKGHYTGLCVSWEDNAYPESFPIASETSIGSQKEWRMYFSKPEILDKVPMCSQYSCQECLCIPRINPAIQEAKKGRYVWRPCLRKTNCQTC